MRNFIITVLLEFGFICGAYAQHLKIEDRIKKNENGDFCFETSFPELLANGIKEEVRVQNNSTFTVNNISCNIIINEKTHSLKTIQKLKPGEEEEFDGYEDDEMKDELPYYFGTDGEFKKRNTNAISFVICFRDHQKNVTIKGVYDRDKSLVFIIDNSTEGNENMETETSLKEAGVKKITVDGKTFILYNGKFIPVDD